MASDDRTRAMRDAFEKLYSISMGCHVPEMFCPVCKAVVTECGHVRAARAQWTDEMASDFHQLHGIKIKAGSEKKP